MRGLTWPVLTITQTQIERCLTQNSAISQLRQIFLHQNGHIKISGKQYITEQSYRIKN